MEVLVDALNTFKAGDDYEKKIEELTWCYILDNKEQFRFARTDNAEDVEAIYDSIATRTTMTRDAFLLIFSSLKEKKVAKQQGKVLHLLRNRNVSHARIAGHVYKLLELMDKEDAYDGESDGDEAEKMVHDLFPEENDKPFLIVRLKEVYGHLDNQEEAVSTFLDKLKEPWLAVGFLAQLDGWDEGMTRAEGRQFFEKSVIPHCISPMHSAVWEYFCRDLVFVDDDQEPTQKKVKTEN